MLKPKILTPPLTLVAYQKYPYKLFNGMGIPIIPSKSNAFLSVRPAPAASNAASNLECTAIRKLWLIVPRQRNSRFLIIRVRRQFSTTLCGQIL